MDRFELGRDSLSVDLLGTFVATRPELILNESVMERLHRAHTLVLDASLRGELVYGLTTGVGPQLRFPVQQGEDDLAAFNRQLILDHAGGVGPELSETVCYAVALARLHGLALGGSGIAPPVLAHAVKLLNLGIVPVIPTYGSVGASDLSACAAMTGAWFLGEGSVYYQRGVRSAAAVLDVSGHVPPRFSGKDSLSFLNSNALTLGYGSLLDILAREIFKIHLETIALSFEAYGANVSALAPAVHALRPHDRQAEVAAILRTFLADSYLWEEGAARNLQDPLSFRCVPQVGGALLERLERLERRLGAELNAISDNPVVLVEEGQILSNGNFDSTNLCLDVDTVSQALVRLALAGERRIDKLLTGSFSDLPTNLSDQPTAYGLGILNYTAASLVAEAVAESVGGVPQLAPVAEGIEDVGALTPLSLRRLRRLLDIVLTVAAIEALVAARAIHLRTASRIARVALVEQVDAAICNIHSPGPQAQAVKQAFVHCLTSELLAEFNA